MDRVDPSFASVPSKVADWMEDHCSDVEAIASLLIDTVDRLIKAEKRIAALEAKS